MGRRNRYEFASCHVKSRNHFAQVAELERAASISGSTLWGIEIRYQQAIAVAAQMQRRYGCWCFHDSNCSVLTSDTRIAA